MCEENAQEKCKSKHEAYLKLLEIHNQNRIDYNDRKWETIKLSQALFTALIAATGGGIWAISQSSQHVSCELRLAATLPIILTWISLIFAYLNLQQEAYRGFRDEAQYIQILGFLRLPYEFKGGDESRRWLLREPNLIFEKWRGAGKGIHASVKGISIDYCAHCWIRKRVGNNEFSNTVFWLFFFEAIVAAIALGIVWKIDC